MSANSYVCRSYRGKLGRGWGFWHNPPPPPSPILNRVNTSSFSFSVFDIMYFFFLTENFIFLILNLEHILSLFFSHSYLTFSYLHLTFLPISITFQVETYTDPFLTNSLIFVYPIGVFITISESMFTFYNVMMP